jgi:hypothetical protein
VEKSVLSVLIVMILTVLDMLGTHIFDVGILVMMVALLMLVL